MTAITASDTLRWAADHWGNRPAFESPGLTLGFVDLDAAVDRLAGEMAAIGVRARSPVMLEGLGAAEGLPLVLAVWRLGALATLAPERLPAGTVDRLAGDLPDPVRVGGRGHDPGPLLAALRNGGAARRFDPPAGPRRRATVLYTSGSSGIPKAVVHRLYAHLVAAAALANHLGFGPGARWLHSLPSHHVGGLAPLVRTLVAGGTLVVGAARRLEVRSMAESGATHVSVVRTQLLRLLDEGRPVPPALRCMLVGGGPVEADLLARARSAGWPVVTSYGMTETGSAITAGRPGDAKDLATSGHALPHVTVSVAVDGEILVRGPSLPEGILRSGRVVPVRDERGWFHTGDRGVLDATGRLTVEGRIDRQFVSGGENVRPEAIERCLREVAGITDATVVPVRDREYGQRPVAFVSGPFDAIALRDELTARLPSFMIPVAFLPYDDPDDPAKPSLAALSARAESIRKASRTRTE